MNELNEKVYLKQDAIDKIIAFFKENEIDSMDVVEFLERNKNNTE